MGGGRGVDKNDCWCITAMVCINGLAVTFRAQWFYKVFPNGMPRPVLAFPTTRKSASKKQKMLSLTSFSCKFKDEKGCLAVKAVLTVTIYGFSN